MYLQVCSLGDVLGLWCGEGRVQLGTLLESTNIFANYTSTSDCPHQLDSDGTLGYVHRYSKDA